MGELKTPSAIRIERSKSNRGRACESPHSYWTSRSCECRYFLLKWSSFRNFVRTGRSLMSWAKWQLHVVVWLFEMNSQKCVVECVRPRLGSSKCALLTGAARIFSLLFFCKGFQTSEKVLDRLFQKSVCKFREVFNLRNPGFCGVLGWSRGLGRSQVKLR